MVVLQMLMVDAEVWLGFGLRLLAVPLEVQTCTALIAFPGAVISDTH